MVLSLLNQYAGVIVVPYYGTFELAEVISFLENEDYTFIDFISDYSDNDAVVNIKGAGTLYICNLSGSTIPAETVRLVIDALDHWDECLKQVYGWLRFWDFKNDEWRPSKYKEWLEEWTYDDFEKRYEITEVFFGLDDWPVCDKKEYCLGPEPEKGADVFSIEVRCDPLGFNLKFRCKDRRLYKIVVHIL